MTGLATSSRPSVRACVRASERTADARSTVSRARTSACGGALWRLEAATTRANGISVHTTTGPRPEADMGRVGGRGRRAGGRGADARSERRREAGTTRTQRAKRTHCYRQIHHVIDTTTNYRATERIVDDCRLTI